VLSDRKVGLVVRVERAKVDAFVRADAHRTPPVEPTIAVEQEHLVVRSGEAGRGLDPDRVTDAIEGAARGGATPVAVAARPVRLAPRFSRRDATALLSEAERLTAADLRVTAAGHTATVPVAMLRSWVAVDATGAALEITFDPTRAVADLGRLLPDAGSPAIDASVVIADGPVIRDGVEGTGCCAPESAGMMLEALVAGRGTELIDLPLTVRPPARSRADLEKLGLVELVGGFTTRHPAGQPRVTNIHRIADIVRGVILEPGATFSVNDFVGRRTTEKGFIPGGVIEGGVFTEDVGGGVSQFATTLFNAAFFGGLDILEYQPHSLYISRYPYGREATLSCPAPDLVIRNPSPHGVLIWTEYTSTSIRVSLWSTRFATGEQTDQTTAPAGSCTRVRTERTRTNIDGTSKKDYFTATYRPAEGQGC
jgi:vancomycin resistance protein YoaR